MSCEACGHVMEANAGELARELHRRRLSPKVEAIEKRAKCSHCGERQATVTAVATDW